MSAPRVTAVAGLMLAVGLLVRLVAASDLAPGAARLAQFPIGFAAWRGSDLPRFDSDTEATLGADTYLLRVYNRGGAPLTLFVAYYATQASGRALHSPLNCLPGSGWEMMERGEVPVPLTSDATGRLPAVTVNRAVARLGANEDIIYYWYQSHGRVVANEYANRLLLIRDALVQHRSDGALVRITGAASADREAASFVGAVYPLLTRFLPE